MIPKPLEKAPCLYLAEENHGKTGSACLAVVEAKDLTALARDFLAAGFHLEDVSGLDTADGAVSAYHFDHFDAPCRVTVLVTAPHDAPCFPSIASVYHGAEWHERETRDFFGFTYEGNPNLIPLLLPENMEDVHPLRKEEGARATLAALFSAEGRERTVVRKADGFSLLDAPVKAEPAAEAAPEAEEKPAAKPASKAKSAAPAEKAVADESGTDKDAKSAKAQTLKPETAAASPEEKPKAEPKSGTTDEKAPAPAKKTAKAASGKKGEGNA